MSNPVSPPADPGVYLKEINFDFICQGIVTSISTRGGKTLSAGAAE
jgi:hypothetical protein